MSKPCRLTKAHQHRTFSPNTMRTHFKAELNNPSNTHLLRVRWIDATHEHPRDNGYWQACYIPQVPT